MRPPVTPVTRDTSATHRYGYGIDAPTPPTVGFVQPSSLIFLVIVAIWVAYLVQHWVRRREQLATARSVDKFSEAMRVLERRNPLPTTTLARSTSAAGAGATGPDSRPEVLVKHASVSSPLRARRGEAALPPAHPVPLIELMPHRSAADVAMRRVRGILFLAALVAVPVTFVLSVANILKWLSVAIAGAALLGSVVWLRASAIQEQKARKAKRLQKRRLEEAAKPRRRHGTGPTGSPQVRERAPRIPPAWRPREDGSRSRSRRPRTPSRTRPTGPSRQPTPTTPCRSTSTTTMSRSSGSDRAGASSVAEGDRPRRPASTA